MKIDRRKFIALATLGIPLGVLSYKFLNIGSTSPRGIAIGSGQYMTKEGDMQFVLSIFNLDNFKEGPSFIKTSFLPHGIVPHPTQINTFILFEKKGPGACEVNLAHRRVIRDITTTNDKYFYGHGAFTRDAKRLFATEAKLESKEGLIAIRDTKTMRLLGEFPSFGKNPHDCHLIDQGNTLVITNGGGDIGSGFLPNISYVDVRTQKLIEKVGPSNTEINTGHLALSRKKDLIVVSAPRDSKTTSLGGISFKPHDKSHLKTAAAPSEVIEKMRSETFSIALHEESQIVAVTNPIGNIITFWNFISGEFIDSLKIENPRSIGLTKDQNHFIVGHGNDARLSLIAVTNFKLEKDFSFSQAGFSGSHMLII